MQQNNDNIIIDIGFILFQKFDFNKYHKIPLLKDCFLKLLKQTDELDEYEINKISPYLGKESIIEKKKIVKWEIENNRLNDNDLLSYSIYNVAIYPLNKYFYAMPLLYLKEVDFEKLSKNAILRKIYYNDEYAQSHQTITINAAYEGFVLSDVDSIQFINEIKVVTTDFFLIDVFQRFEEIKDKCVIIQKAL